MNIDIKPCPFCGGDELIRSVDGGILPSYIDIDKEVEILKKTPYVSTCALRCKSCGAEVEGYAASNNWNDDLCNKAIDDCYKKWNRRTDNDN